MNAIRLAIGALVYGMASLASAQVIPLGAPSTLPILEGGMLTIAVAGLVIGIRIVRRKKNR
ncbi:MAG: hypothetical protein Q7T48_06420 [Cellvibrio sp.]|uniref:hypothetical protein n=1 Tax=Cellvibrio sp. TaxID=1965322 RepID=UPI00271F088B|nr:hypothetical protein [Cellvibrio sp.]